MKLSVDVYYFQVAYMLLAKQTMHTQYVWLKSTRSDFHEIVYVMLSSIFQGWEGLCKLKSIKRACCFRTI